MLIFSPEISHEFYLQTNLVLEGLMWFQREEKYKFLKKSEKIPLTCFRRHQEAQNGHRWNENTGQNVVEDVEQWSSMELDPNQNHRPSSPRSSWEANDLLDGQHVEKVEFAVIEVIRQIAFVAVQLQIDFWKSYHSRLNLRNEFSISLVTLVFINTFQIIMLN